MVDNIIMYTGLGITIIDLLLLVSTTKWVNGWFINYKTTNRPLAFVGWILLLLGLAVFILPLYLSGRWD